MLSYIRNLSLAGLALVAGGLLVMIFAAGSILSLSRPAVLCGLAGLIVLLLLGWYWLSLCAQAGAIARHLENGKPERIKTTRGFLPKLFAGPVAKCFQSYDKHIEELQEQLSDLRIRIQLSDRRKDNIQAIIFSIRDAVIVIDSFGKLLLANPPAGELFGFDLNNAGRKPITELVGNPEFLRLLDQSRESKAQHIKRHIEFTTDENTSTFDCITSCIYDDERNLCGVVAVLHDISRERQAARAKNEFVNHVSHELKTPLASITAYAEMLVDGEAEDEKARKEFLAVIQDQAQRLNRMIENLLNISRIESGLMKVNKEPLSLTVLIHEVVRTLKSYAAEKNIELIEQSPIACSQVYADRDMITQVLINLLGNAIKYTPAGGSVKLRTEVNEAGGAANVTITDTGPGIPSKEISHVFDKFYRVGADSNSAKGTGLGLNLVKQIIEKVHNGRVFVTSQPGSGSTFGFELPLISEQAAVTS
jgi:two-component system phosphate regulon sensor histidine kinase PhoR